MPEFRKLALMILLYFGIVCNYLTYAIMAPFFPSLALKKGLSTFQYSLVFTVYSISQLVTSVLMGRYLMKITPKFAVCAGLLLSGGSTIIFGIMEKCPGPTLFFTFCLIARIIEGFGFSAYLTSCFSILISEFPDMPGSVTGLAELFVTIAMISGPPIGGILYTLGGYICPFLVFGVLMVLMTGISLCLVPDKNIPDSSSISLSEYKAFLQLPEAWMNIICVTMNVMADAFITITLFEFVEQFSTLNPMELGGVFLCLFLSYGVSAPVSGWMADRWRIEYQLQSLGCIVLAVSFSVLGPATYFSFKPSVILVIASLLIKGIGAGPLISCSMSSALRAAQKNIIIEDEFRIHSMVSSSVTFSIPLGNVLGSTLSGIMFAELGMHLCCTIFASAFLLLGIVLFTLAVWNCCNNIPAERENLINNRTQMQQLRPQFSS